MVHLIKALIQRFMSVFLTIFCYAPQVVYYYVKNQIRWWPSILEIIEGECSHPRNVYAIFVMWQPKETPWYVLNALNALAEAGVNVLLVVNHPLPKDRLKELMALSHTIMLRDNTGFDIGAYKDASLYLNQKTVSSLERVIYLNDSCYYFKEGLKELFYRLTESTADACSAFENWNVHYHLQSFCLSVSGELFRHPKFQGFWKKYLPADIRRWAINHGEVGLTNHIVPIAQTIEIIYKVDEILEKLGSLSNDELVTCEYRLPRVLRGNYDNIGNLPVIHFPTEIAFRISTFSQIHTGAFLFRDFFRCPLMKRDLVFRGFYTIYEVKYFLGKTSDDEHLPKILDDIRKKGLGENLKGLKRWKYRIGML